MNKCGLSMQGLVKATLPGNMFRYLPNVNNNKNEKKKKWKKTVFTMILISIFLPPFYF